MGLSRNKVSVPEGADGLPPFLYKEIGDWMELSHLVSQVNPVVGSEFDRQHLTEEFTTSTKFDSEMDLRYWIVN